MRGCLGETVGLGKFGEPSQGFDSRQEKVGSAAYGGEGGQPPDRFADGAIGDLEFQRAVLGADDRIAFVFQLVKVPVIHPYVLRKLELADEARANDGSRDAPLPSVVGRAVRAMRAVSKAAPD